MRLTIGRWIAAILACCAFVAALLLPLPTKARTTWFGQSPRAMSSSVEALAAAAEERNDAIRTYRVAQGLARWRTNTARDSIQIDRDTPAPVADFMRTVAQNQWRRVGQGASANHVAVFVYFDTSTIEGFASPNNKRIAEPRRPADVWYALPEATDGNRCVVLVRVRAATVAQVTHLRERSLLGPCAYFGAFGKPGRMVRQWLEATNYRAARLPDWDTPRPPAVDGGTIYTLSPEASRCLTGDRGACGSAVGARVSGGAGSGIVDGNSLSESSRRRILSLGEASPRLLADAVREFGHQRFARFWTSDAPLESAFAGAANMPLDQWTAGWLERSYGAPQQLPAIRVADVLWLAIALPLLIVVAALKRERVLAERFRLMPPAMN